MYSHTILFWCGEKQIPSTKYLLELIKRRSKVQEKKYVSKEICRENIIEILTNERHFPKTISQWVFDYALFTNLPRIIVNSDFSPNSFKLKRIPLLCLNEFGEKSLTIN